MVFGIFLSNREGNVVVILSQSLLPDVSIIARAVSALLCSIFAALSSAGRFEVC